MASSFESCVELAFEEELSESLVMSLAASVVVHPFSMLALITATQPLAAAAKNVRLESAGAEDPQLRGAAWLLPSSKFKASIFLICKQFRVILVRCARYRLAARYRRN
jgi:hypothetical protein